MSGEEVPLKITDRRRIVYDRETNSYRGHDTSDDGQDAFRTASFGWEPVPRRAAPPEEPRSKLYVPTGDNVHRGETGHPSVNHHLPIKGLFLGLTAATILIGAYNGNFFGRFYSPPKNEQAYATGQAGGSNTPPRMNLNINTAAFNEYQRQSEERHEDFRSSRRIAGSDMRQIPVPEGLPPLGDGLGAGAFAFDIEGDGAEEIYLQEGCGSGGCSGRIYQNNGSGYVEILDTHIDSISRRTVNGKPVVSDIRKHYLPGGGFIDMVVEYSWDGQRFSTGDSFFMPEFLPPVADSIRSSFDNRNPGETSRLLGELEKTIGTDNALRAFLQAQAPPGFTMPTGSEYVEYVRQYAMEVERTNPGMGERALTRYADDPGGFFKAVYSRSSEPVFLDISNPKSVVGASLVMTLKRLGRSDWERHMDLWNRAQNKSGFIAAHMNATGRYPQTEEELWSARNNVVREDKIPARGSGDSSNYGSWSSQSGSGSSRTFNPVDVPGDPRYLNSRPPPQTIRESAGQMDRATQQGIMQGAERSRQMINQGISQGGRAVGEMLRMPQPAQGRGRGGGQ
ncbi:MAG: hypothetical protein QT00_C0001G0262 [archaeon GW2011_AR5]|nr:MAG: hypothetical protein QT00_C0001G0262 [archaeon GW2011_AR5]